MKNLKIIAVFIIIGIIAYIDDPNNFSLNDEVSNNQTEQANIKYNNTSTPQKQKSFFESRRFTGGTKVTTISNRANQGKTMTIAKCIQPADRILTGAFMLPPGWQVQCETQYSLKSNTVWPDPLFKAQKSGTSIQLFNEVSQHFYYDRLMREKILQSKSMVGVDGSIFGPEFASMLRNNTQEFMRQWDAEYPQAIDLVQLAKNRAHKLNQMQGYKVFHISRDPIANTFQKLIKQNKITINAVTLIAHEINNPNKIKMMKIIQAIIPLARSDQYTWHLIPFVATGNKQDEAEMSKLINLVINTQQQNPVFTQMVAKINLNLSRQARKSFAKISEITRSTYEDINNIYQNTYKNTSASSDRMQSKWVDGMLEVENYTNPFDGKMVKMPMHNKYYFTNNLDDYLGTNNPLLDPNVDLNYLYNWRKLEKSAI